MFLGLETVHSIIQLLLSLTGSSPHTVFTQCIHSDSWPLSFKQHNRPFTCSVLTPLVHTEKPHTAHFSFPWWNRSSGLLVSEQPHWDKDQIGYGACLYISPTYTKGQEKEKLIKFQLISAKSYIIDKLCLVIVYFYFGNIYSVRMF